VKAQEQEGNRMSITIGLVTIAEPLPRLESARQNLHASVKALEALGAKVVTTRDVLTDLDAVRAEARRLRHEEVDLLVIQLGAWAPDEFSICLTREVSAPFMIWAIPEKLTGHFPDGGLVGMTQTGGTLAKMGMRFNILYGAPDDEQVLCRIRTAMKAVDAAKRLRSARVGLVGGHCPGMTDATFHELELKKVIGVEVDHIDLSVLANAIADADHAEAQRIVAHDMPASGTVVDPSEADLLEAARTYLGLRALVREHGLDALAVKCWPELKQLGLASPCYALSRLSDEGVMAACEGDLTAAVSMLILHALTDSPAYLTDFLTIERDKNTVLGFHCGAAASELADPDATVQLRLHDDKTNPDSCWKAGVTVDFPVKPGRVTFARLGEVRGTYRLIIMGGQALPAEMFVRGNTIRLKMDTDVMEVLEKTIREGHEHHYVLAHGDVTDELIELAELLGIGAVLI